MPERYNIGVDVCDRHAVGAPRTALIVEDADGGVRRFSFHDIREQSDRLGSALGELGLVRGDRGGGAAGAVAGSGGDACRELQGGG